MLIEVSEGQDMPVWEKLKGVKKGRIKKAGLQTFVLGEELVAGKTGA